jgi:hypothetical protein
MMQEHVKLMQSQLTKSFDLITDKMQQMESRIVKADTELQNQGMQH